VAGAVGVLIPLSGRRRRFLRPDGNPFFITKVFAAGVILATAFIHMLPATPDTVANPCLPDDLWGKFAWAGLISMVGALGTLVLDFTTTEFYLNREKRQQNLPKVEAESKGIATLHSSQGTGNFVNIKDH
jgi:zinc transporter 1/2/3